MKGARYRWPSVGFVLVLAAQLWLIGAAGTDIPFQDQWDVEGKVLYPAVRGGSVSVSALLAPHNEHRIFWTRLLDVVLFRLNGQWDPLVQLVAGALLHAAIAALLVARLSGGGGFAAVGALMFVLLFSLPVAGWHNALWGFQSQVYFAVLFALAAFALLGAESYSAPRAVVGWLAVLAAMLAMGPGLLVPLSLALGLAWRARHGRVGWRQAGPMLLLLGLTWGMYQGVPAHDNLRAGSLARFLEVLLRLLAWPHTAQPWAAPILNLPLLAYLLQRWRCRLEPRPGEDFVLMTAAWALLVAGAAAWSRGGGTEFDAGVPSRYVDFIVLLPLTNLWCLLWLVRPGPRSLRWAATAWAMFLLVGWLGLSMEVYRGVILPRARDREAPVRLMQAFQHTDDPAVFAGKPRLLVPHPNLESVRVVLHDPRMAGILPPSLQPERPVGPLSGATRALLGR